MRYAERPIAARNPWLARPRPGRGAEIAGVMLHSTRSGVRDGDDGPRTERWWADAANIVADEPPWGSYADLLIYEDGTRVVCTDIDHEYATWTAGYGRSGTWAAGIPYVQIELAQGTIDEPFTDAQVESLAEAVAALAQRYAFPLVRISFLAQTGVPPRGICTHEDSANGRVYGKSDPGPLFPWTLFLAKAQAMIEGGVDVEKLTELEARIAVLEQWREQLVPRIDADWAWREEQQRRQEPALPEHSHEPGPVRRVSRA